ncbi:tetratricopeptide repeat protein [Piscinibacter sakaiensis]|uniref:tetratricopeptide repeat protein n=1 Tax=Piscinibacter sakaiensis TaxID=1547922 RepID=UPI00372C5FD2
MDASPAPAPLPDTAPGAPPDAPPDTPPEPREISLQDFLDEARAAQRAGRLAEAEAMYLHLLQQAPDEPNALNFLGVLRFQQGLHDLALATLMRAIRAAPDDAGPWINLANVLIETDRLDDAVKALGNAAALAPRSVQIVNNLGVLHLRRQDWGLAEQHLRRALELWPERSYLHENLAQVCLATGRAQEAEQHLARALLCMGPRSLSRKLMLIAHDVLGDRAAALRTVQEWLEAEPDNPEARHHLAALGAAVVPPRAPDDYVSQLFDGFAQSFDAQLARLGYRGPTLVVDELRRLREGLPAEATVVDAGCGTDLCGPGLRRPVSSASTCPAACSGTRPPARATTSCTRPSSAPSSRSAVPTWTPWSRPT